MATPFALPLLKNGINKTKMRFACKDAPETSQAPYGNDAPQALQADLPIGTEVGLRTKATDRNGCTGDRRLLNPQLYMQKWSRQAQVDHLAR